MTPPALTQPVLLKPCQIDDAAALFPFASDPELTRYLTWAPHQAVEETQEVLASLAEAHAGGRAYHWTIWVSRDACGIVSLIDIRRRHRTWRLDRAELAYWVGQPWWGQGIAGRAAQLAVDQGFAGIGLQKIMIANVPENAASGRIAARLGARLIGEEHRAFEKDGRWHNLVWRELLNDHGRLGEGHAQE